MSKQTPVSWDTAARVAVWVAEERYRMGSTPEPIDATTWAGLEADFTEATERAEGLVVAATGLGPDGSATGEVVDRGAWVRGNIRSFQRLLDPLMARLDAPMLPGPLGTGARAATGAQLGAVLGWMSTRVLGQYDVLLAEGDETAGRAVSYVGPNIVAIERRYGFPPASFRLWIALHEVTHRCQFTGVPWLQAHFLSLVDQALGVVTPDPRRLAASLASAAKAVRAGANPLDEAGIVGLVAPPEQVEVIRKIQAMMSLLEGHGDVTMDRAGAEAVPEAAWFSATLRERRRQAGPAARLLQQLIGLDAKLKQYEMGERFIAAVEAAGGRALFDRVWEGPEHLPTLEEIREPDRWIARMGEADGVQRVT